MALVEELMKAAPSAVNKWVHSREASERSIDAASPPTIVAILPDIVRLYSFGVGLFFVFVVSLCVVEWNTSDQYHT